MSSVTPLHGLSCQCRGCVVDDIVREVVGALAKIEGADTGQGLYRYRDAADWMGVSETKLREWVDRGLIDTVQFDSCVRIPAESLRAFKSTWRERA